MLPFPLICHNCSIMRPLSPPLRKTVNRVKCTMSQRPELFQVSFDGSGLSGVLDGHDSRMDQHDAKIQELFDMMRKMATKDDLDALRNELKACITAEIGGLRAEMDDKVDRMCKKIGELEGKMDQALGGNDMNAELEDKLSALSKKVDGVESDVDDVSKKVKKMTEKVDDVSKTVEACDTKVNENRAFIQSVASAYAGLNRATATLDGTLHRTLGGSTEKVKADFAKIFEALKDLTKRMNGQETTGPVVVERSVVQEPTKIDLSHLNLRSAESVEFDDHPELPDIYKFCDIENSVDYMYQLVPKLQSILDCYHNKISTIPNGDQDRQFLSDLIDKIRNAMMEMSRELESLKNSMGKSLTKAEVARMIREMTNVEEDNPQTAVGCVKCIACGRDMRQVAGAMTEDEALKMLGAPPNSVAVFPPGIGAVGQQFARTLDRESLDSPRSTRPARKVKVVKQYRPQPPMTP